MPGVPNETDDNDMESAPAATVGATAEETAMAEPTTSTDTAAAAVTLTGEQFAALLARVGTPAPAAESAPVVPAETVTETEEQRVERLVAERVAASVTETEEQRIERLVAERVTAAMASAAPAESVQETEEQRIDRLVAERVSAALPAAVQETVLRQGPPARKGYADAVTEHRAPAAEGGLSVEGLPADWPSKPLHQFTSDERRDYFGPSLEAYVLGARAQQPAQ
jgi:hypothetical protein